MLFSLISLLGFLFNGWISFDSLCAFECGCGACVVFEIFCLVMDLGNGILFGLIDVLGGMNLLH